MSLATAADYGWIRNSEVFRLGWEVGYTLALANGYSPEELVSAVGAELCGTGTGINPIVDATLDGLDVAGVVALPGDNGPWTLIVAITDEIAMRQRRLGALSRGDRRVVVHSSNGGKPMDFFFWYQDGALRTEFESSWDREGTTPDDLVPLMRDVGLDVDEELDLDVYDEKAAVLALAERLTGVRITERLLCETEFQLIRVPDVSDET